MAEENDDKTEAPHPTDLKKRVRKGAEIPRSRRATSLLILIVGCVHHLVGWGSRSPETGGMLSAGLRFDHSMVNDPNLILSCDYSAY